MSIIKVEDLKTNLKSVLDETVDKVKAGTKAVINKVKDTDKDLGDEYNKEKSK